MQQLFYRFIKVWVRVSLKFFCKQVVIHNPGKHAAKGPLIIAAHHPNSFFDAIIIGAFMHQPVHYITRGDVFNKRWARFLLAQLNMIPIFRLRDGKDKLSLNQKTFEQSVEILKNNGILLIFVEGFCEYQTTLLPLKKGAPRILLSCWQQGINAGVLPVWPRYHSFFAFGKRAEMNMGNIFGREAINNVNPGAEAVTAINIATAQELTRLSAIENKFTKNSLLFRWLLLLPALLGWLLNYPLYISCRLAIYPLAKENHHYDSIMFAVLTFIYPLYVTGIALIAFYFTENYYSFLLLLLLPLLARCYVVWKK